MNCRIHCINFQILQQEPNLVNVSVFCEVKVNNSNLNKSLHGVLELKPVIILIILFCCRKTFSLSTEFPPNVMPYSIVPLKYAKQIILRVDMLL